MKIRPLVNFMILQPLIWEGDVLDKVEQFLTDNLAGMIFSTSATVVHIAQDVYNVTGSSKDPKIGGKSWKRLLKDNGITGPCYVTNQKPDRPDTSHQKGSWLGGHMALTKDGKIAPGGDSYLMPLCSWHNSTKRNKKNFAHTRIKMLELGGYMEGQNAFTFHIRRKDLGEHRIAVKGEQGWEVMSTDALDGKSLVEMTERLSIPEKSPFIILSLAPSAERLIVTDARI